MTIKILQWNIWYKEDPQKIISELKRIDADVICLQEVTIGNSLHDNVNVVELLRESTGFNLHHQEMKNGGDGTQANVILSQYPVKSSRYVWINEPSGSGGYDDEYRCYIEVELAVEGKALTVGTTHMSYAHKFEETGRKLEESAKLIKELSNRECFVFTGDLNVIPQSNTISDISNLLVHAGPDMKESTWTTKPFEYKGFRAETLDSRLDYVFTSKDIKVNNSRAIKTEYSDHLPILLEIQI